MSSARRLAFPLGCWLLWAMAAYGSRWLGIWVGLGGAAVVLGVAVLAHGPRAALGLSRPSAGTVAIGVASGALMVAATQPLYALLARVAPLVVDDVGHLYAVFRGHDALVSALLLGPVILGEELVWRGSVQGALRERLTDWPAAGVTAIAYALAHAPLGSPAVSLAALGCGLVWSGLRAATKSIVPSLVSHVVWDVMVLMVLPMPHS